MLDRIKPLLVGENNPYSSDPRLALYHKPPNAAGDRLRRLILGVSVKQYIGGFERVNLCSGAWSMPEARARASRLQRDRAELMVRRGQPYCILVLLGAKVADAFGLAFEPCAVRLRVTHGDDGEVVRQQRVVMLPHPSGRNRAWNDPSAVHRAREALRRAGVEDLGRLVSEELDEP